MFLAVNVAFLQKQFFRFPMFLKNQLQLCGIYQKNTFRNVEGAFSEFLCLYFGGLG